MLVRTIRVVVGQQYISMSFPFHGFAQDALQVGAPRIANRRVINYLSIGSVTTFVFLFFTASREQHSMIAEGRNY
jgi:hypothetical protein